MICVEFGKLFWTGCSPWTSWAALDTLNLFSTSTFKRMHKDLRDVTDLQHIWSQDWNSSSICYFPQSNQIGSICYCEISPRPTATFSSNTSNSMPQPFGKYWFKTSNTYRYIIKYSYMHPARKNNLLLFVCGWKIPRAAENGNIAAQCENTSIVWNCLISF